MAAEPAALRMERLCPDCGGRDFVEDHAAGDIVCRGCGLVVEAHIIDERSEWRTFGDKDKESDDPSRVGAAANPLLGDGGLSTSIGKLPGIPGGQYSMLHKLHNRQSSENKSMIAANKEIGANCDKLRLADSVRNAALEIFRDVHDAKALRGRQLKSVYAACIYFACKREGHPRTFKEICAVLTDDVSKVDVGRCFTAIDRMYKHQAQHKALARGEDLAGAVAAADPSRLKQLEATQPKDIIKRYISRLGVEQALSQFAHRIGHEAEQLAREEHVPWGSRDPATQTAALVYGACQIYKLKHPGSAEQVPTWDSLSVMSGLAPSTIRDCYRQMLPYFAAGKLVAAKDAGPEILNQLEACFRQAPAPSTIAAVQAAQGRGASSAAAAGGSASSARGRQLPRPAGGARSAARPPPVPANPS